MTVKADCALNKRMIIDEEMKKNKGGLNMTKEELEHEISKFICFTRYGNCFINDSFSPTIFTDKDNQLLELYHNLQGCRHSGRTNRLVNKYIEEMFERPMGTPIAIHDHYGSLEGEMAHLNASKMLLCKIEERLHNEYPSVEYEAKLKNGTCILTRTSPTTREQWQEQFGKEITRKLEELNAK